MSKPKSLTLLLSLGVASLLSACDPVQAVLDDLRPAKDLCLDQGGDSCKPPKPTDLKAP